MTPGEPPSDGPAEAPRLVRPRVRAPGAGRPRKSAELHALEGTRSRAPRRPKPLDDRPVADADIPPALLSPPKWLHKYAQCFWTETAPALARAGRLKVHHLEAWRSLCIEVGNYERMQRKLARLPVTDKAFAEVGALARSTLVRIQSACLRFGLDPAGDARLSAIDGSSVGGAAPAAVTTSGPPEESRAARWARKHGAGA